LGGAYNSNAENILQTPYTVTYKTMQYAWYHNQFNTELGLSFLLLNTGYEYANPDAKLLVDYKQTFGTYLTYKKNKIDTVIFGYTVKQEKATIYK
jgi:hypothetical protein